MSELVAGHVELGTSNSELGTHMDPFKSMATYAHEQLVLCHEPSCGYFGIIAIHDTTLGPAHQRTADLRRHPSHRQILPNAQLATGDASPSTGAVAKPWRRL